MTTVPATAGLDLGNLSPAVERAVAGTAARADFEAWSTTAAGVHHCVRPVRLHGSSTTVDSKTGEVLSRFSSGSQPLGVLHLPCGNRRADVCPACSRRYAADTFHLIRAGVVGGKGVPASVGSNPIVFATLTAPSFGAVHRTGSRCVAGRPGTCVHGQSTRCIAQHDDDDPMLGQPLCTACYDYAAHVVWQWWAPELWRYFAQQLKRRLARELGVPEKRLNDVATVQFAKVAEYQRRGAIHFHALVRLDGPKSATGFAPAPADLGAAEVAGLIRDVAAGTSVVRTAPDGTTRELRFGSQIDARPVTASQRVDLDGERLTPEQVAGYLAKYATKSATASAGEIHANHHLARLMRTTMALGAESDPDGDYALLSRWAHMLGFRGHFSTRSRGYSVTMTRIRSDRRRYQRLASDCRRSGVDLTATEIEELLARDDDETVLVIGHWSFAGIGWRNEGEVALARAAAAHAQEYARVRAALKSSAADVHR